MSATTTADKSYSYSKIYHGKSLTGWVEGCHRFMSNKSGWKYFSLAKGSFGFDNQAVSIGYLFDHYKEGMTIEQASEYVHEGWIKNYIYWRDNSPFKTDSLYKKPAKLLNDQRRNECANQSYKDLPEDEKEKDRFVAEYILTEMTKKPTTSSVFADDD